MSYGLLPGRKLTLISAPAGFGKTTLAVEWALDTGMPVAWLALDEGDNDPIRFWHYMIAALQSLMPEAGQSMLEALQSPQPPPLASLVVLLINDLSVQGQPFLLVLDDYHLIEVAEVHDSFNYLLDHLPPNAHLALLTRSDPPLHLARRRGRGEICEVRASDLRFTLEEIEQFLTRTMNLSLDRQDIDALEARTEGWVAGLQMAAISLQGRSDSHELVSAFTGDDRYIADYLVEEVLQRQPSYVRAFLLKTSILERICAPLCEALLEPPELENHIPAALLNDLDRSNLFIVPLDNRREWFRYHHLFAQLLRQKLDQEVGPERMRQLYHLASQWHMRNNDPFQAVEYAFASQDYPLAARLILETAPVMFRRAELNTLVRWSEMLPVEVLSNSTRLCMGLGWAANATGHPQQHERLLRLVEEKMGMTVQEFLDLDTNEIGQIPNDRRFVLVEAAVQRMRMAMDQGNTRAILERYSKLQDYLPEDRFVPPSAFNSPMDLRPVLSFAIAIAYDVEGELEQAEALFQETVRVSRQIYNPFLIAVGLGHLGQVQIRLGRLRDAGATFQDALKHMTETGGSTIAFYGISYAGQGMIEYERNRLDEAEWNFGESLRLGKLWSSWEALLPGYIGMAQVKFIHGDDLNAFRMLDEMSESGKNLVPMLAAFSETCRFGFLSRQGRYEQVEKWLQESGYDLNAVPQPQHPDHTLIIARLLVGRNEPDRAARLLDQEMAALDARGFRTDWMHMAALRAIALDACGARDEAVELLDTALRRAAPEGYVRSFLDEGSGIVPLLNILAHTESVSGSYAAKILSEIEGGHPAPQPPLNALIEPLSARELEVLCLLAQGATNAQIASRAYIAVNTVKKHITSIYAKLGVSTRIRALEKARELKLIE